MAQNSEQLQPSPHFSRGLPILCQLSVRSNNFKKVKIITSHSGSWSELAQNTSWQFWRWRFYKILIPLACTFHKRFLFKVNVQIDLLLRSRWLCAILIIRTTTPNERPIIRILKQKLMSVKRTTNFSCSFISSFKMSLPCASSIILSTCFFL